MLTALLAQKVYLRCEGLLNVPAGVQEDLEPGDHFDRGHRRRPCQLQHLHLDQVRTSSRNKHLIEVTNFFRKG